jgi:hypothetical protein
VHSNIDDYLRMAAVPKYKGACFRDWLGVVTNEDGESCDTIVIDS